MVNSKCIASDPLEYAALPGPKWMQNEGETLMPFSCIPVSVFQEGWSLWNKPQFSQIRPCWRETNACLQKHSKCCSIMGYSSPLISTKSFNLCMTFVPLWHRPPPEHFWGTRRWLISIRWLPLKANVNPTASPARTPSSGRPADAEGARLFYHVEPELFRALIICWSWRISTKPD